MIKKFIKICGTGKFLNYNHSAVPAPHRTANFEKINLLYGENGSGKTTLSIILKSLKDNNGLLLKKISFDKTFPQTVEVLTDVTPNPKITFVDNVWDIHYPNLEIFDIYFVNENIYTGLEIQNSHKKNLFEIILGQQGIQLKNDIQQIKDKIQSCNTAIRETTEKIQIAIDEAYNADAYCLLSIDPDIVDKIAEKEREIITATNYQEIQAKTVLSEIQIFTIPYDEVILMAALSKSIDTVSDDYLLKFNERKEHLSMDAAKAEEWIKQGYEAIIDDSCPFCLRPFDATTTEIVEAYRQYFSMEYNSLLRTLSQLNLIISSFNVEAQLLQIEAKIISNQYLIEFWKNYIVSEPAIASIIEQKTKIQSAFETVQSAFKEKLHNPLHAKDTSSIVAFREIIGSLNSKIADFNLQITDYNLKIVAIKLTSPQNITHLESDLKKLRAIKKRGNAPIETLCSSLLTNKQTLGDLRSQKDTKQQELDTYSATISTDYTTKINQYLQAFAPYLEIYNLGSVYVGSSKEPMIKYALHINGIEIKFEDNTSQPSIKYSLSEGDKSALAIAFFLTKLDIEGNINEKIVVFDDPVSSFDLNRKSTTISKLIDIGQHAKQLFVLTHNIVFACEFWKSANQIPLTCQCSKIEYLGNTSCIVEFNIDTETLSSILKDSIAIKDYLTNGCVADQERRSIARCLRPALESYFHLKFFDLLEPNDWLGSFITKVRVATNSEDKFYRLQNSLSELSEINEYSKKYHHRFNNNNESEPVNDAELRNYCNRTLRLIQVI